MTQCTLREDGESDWATSLIFLSAGSSRASNRLRSVVRYVVRLRR